MAHVLTFDQKSFFRIILGCEMTGDDLIKKFKNPVKCGQLKYVNLDCPDIDQTLMKKAFRAINRLFPGLSVDYLPSLNGYDALFVPEDISAGKRALVRQAIEKGIPSIVVQHGAAGDAQGFLPLTADYFLCWPEDREKFIGWGMSEDKVLTFTPQPPRKIRKIPGVKAVFFLVPPAKGRQFEDKNSPKLYTARQLQELITQVLIREPNLLVKPHPKYYRVIEHFLNPRTITWKNAYDLIHSAERIYSFKSCTTVKDCEVLGKKAILVDLWNDPCFLEDQKHMYVVGE